MLARVPCRVASPSRDHTSRHYRELRKHYIHRAVLKQTFVLEPGACEWVLGFVLGEKQLP